MLLLAVKFFYGAIDRCVFLPAFISYKLIVSTSEFPRRDVLHRERHAKKDEAKNERKESSLHCSTIKTCKVIIVGVNTTCGEW